MSPQEVKPRAQTDWPGLCKGGAQCLRSGRLCVVYADGELTEAATIRKIRIVQTEGTREVRRAVAYYNLQMIVAVGFKVGSPRAAQFRKWAGQIVKDYTIQGWTMDKERLKKGHMFTDEYFERQLQYIREIRLSERKFYQKVTDL